MKEWINIYKENIKKNKENHIRCQIDWFELIGFNVDKLDYSVDYIYLDLFWI